MPYSCCQQVNFFLIINNRDLSLSISMCADQVLSRAVVSVTIDMFSLPPQAMYISLISDCYTVYSINNY